MKRHELTDPQLKATEHPNLVDNSQNPRLVWATCDHMEPSPLFYPPSDRRGGVEKRGALPPLGKTQPFRTAGGVAATVTAAPYFCRPYGTHTVGMCSFPRTYVLGHLLTPLRG